MTAVANRSPTAVTDGLSEWLGVWRHSRRVRPAAGAGLALARRVVDQIAHLEPARAEWRAGRVLANQSEFRCVTVVAGGEPVAIVKLAGGPLPRANLRRNAVALRSIEADPRLRGWRHLVPPVLATGTIDGVPYAVEGWVAGTLGDRAAPAVSDRLHLIARAAEAIGRFNRLTAAPPTDTALTDTVRRPAGVLAGSALSSGRNRDLAAAIERLGGRLAADASGRPTAASHGDYWLGNVFFSGGEVAGVIDWSGHRPAAVADVDLVTLVLTSRLIGTRGELGEAVVAVVADGWNRAERELLLTHGTDRWCATPAATLLAWLWLVAGNTEKDPRFSADSYWFRRNVPPVLELF